MNTTRETFEQLALETAIEGLKHIKAFLVYSGSNPEYLKKAKIGAVPVTAYTRLRATMANESAVKMVARRLDLDEADAQKTLRT